MIKKYKISVVAVGIIGWVFFSSIQSMAQAVDNDSTTVSGINEARYDQFYDSLEVKANQNRITRLFYNFLITPPQPYSNNEMAPIEYFVQWEGKTISKIDVTALEVFGPTFEDTTKQAKNWLERTANSIHTKSNLNTIRKSLLFDTGDKIEPELLYENERIIRTLPYIKDVRFIVQPDSINPEAVYIHVITQDRFSLGATGDVNGTKSAALELYNQNIFGIGHEFSIRFVGHLKEQPYTGIETFYKFNNIKGKFINVSAGYMNTYQKKGFSLMVDKPFFTPTINWGYGISTLRMYHTTKVLDDDPFVSPEPFDIAFYSAWAGRSFQINPNKYNNSQLVFSAGIYNRTFHKRPDPDFPGNKYYANNTLYVGSVTYSQRRYTQDQLIYSYGITEDIPEGFKNEIVYGYDANEFGDRQYLHLLLSNGNILVNRRGYMYLSAGIGGYFKKKKFEQGQILANLSFISKQLNTGKIRSRLFFKSNYITGIRRFDVENLNLYRNQEIRGYTSNEAIGKQKLSLSLEYILFLNREFYRFNMALFGFTDLGIIGSNKEFIFTQNYYSGIGAGLRLHNENLVFKTIQIRLAFYPLHPSDMSFVGLILNEQNKGNFYNFNPTAPQPLSFE